MWKNCKNYETILNLYTKKMTGKIKLQIMVYKLATL